MRREAFKNLKLKTDRLLRGGGVGLLGLLHLLHFARLRAGAIHLVLGENGGCAHEEREAEHKGHELFH